MSRLPSGGPQVAPRNLQDRIVSDMLKLTVFMSIVIAFAAPAAVQSGGTANPSIEAKKPSAPMVFYLAKGEPDSCGSGCSEWIAAEGRIRRKLDATLACTLIPYRQT
jgi:hypothetical protein